MLEALQRLKPAAPRQLGDAHPSSTPAPPPSTPCSPSLGGFMGAFPPREELGALCPLLAPPSPPQRAPPGRYLVTEGVALVPLLPQGGTHPQPPQPEADGAAGPAAALRVPLAGLRRGMGGLVPVLLGPSPPPRQLLQFGVSTRRTSGMLLVSVVARKSRTFPSFPVSANEPGCRSCRWKYSIPQTSHSV